MNLKKRLLDAAAGVTDAAQKAIEVARETPDTVGSAFKASVDAVSSSADKVTGTVKDGIQVVGDTVQSARTKTADAISATGHVTGAVVSVGGCVALFSAGVVPLIIFGELPIKLGEEISNSVDEIAKVVRGGKVQFIGVNHVTLPSLLEGALMVLGGPSDMKGSAFAIIYDPHLPGTDSGGCVQLGEEEILRQLRIMSNSRDAREAAYKDAMIGLQYAKKDLGIALDSPDIRFRKNWNPCGDRPQPD